MVKSISNLVKEYFKRHPNKNLPHGPVVDWVEEQYLKQTGKKPRDTWRGIRKLHQEGFLVKVKKGIYRYDPKGVKSRKLEDFPQAIKEAIFKRDNYRCVVCGKGERDGVEIHADHIIPKDRGGKATLENGQTLCSQHNFMKKNLNQTETAKKLFIRLHELSKKKNNKELVDFSRDILNVFEKHGINGHIQWKK